MATSVQEAATGAGHRPGRPPGPSGDFLLGSLRQLRADPLSLFVDSAARYGDLIHFRAGPRHVYLVVGPELIARVGVNNRENYVKGVSYDALRVPIGDALLTADGEKWKARRRLLLPLFSRRSLLAQVPAMAAAADEVSQRWDRFAASGKPVNVLSEMNRLAFDVVGRVLMCAELGEDMRGLEPLIEEASGWVARRTRALVPTPPGIPTTRNRAYRRAETEIRQFAGRLIANRRDAGDGDDIVAGLISALGDNGAALDQTALRDEVIGFLMAGHQTTGAALAWTWYLLSTHRHVDERLGRELTEALGDRAPMAEDLDGLSYLDQVLSESTRLYPPGWAFTRTPLAEDELAGYRIPPGAVVVISPYANQRNPRFWRFPEKFDPERFAPGLPAPDPYHYFPFGVGPHACIGKHMALIEAKTVLALLVCRYRLELLSDAPPVPDPGITLLPRDPILARIYRRKR
jgi:cytochrome P450